MTIPCRSFPLTAPALYLILTFFFVSCTNEDPAITHDSAYFNAIEDNDIALAAPQEGDWRYSHKEKIQDLKAYKKCNPVRQGANHSTIYLMPVGDFTLLQQTALRQVREYVEIFFQMRTVLLSAIADSAITAVPSRGHDGHTQLLAPYLLDSLLKDKCPSDGIALMAISAKDLYPKNDWNYVFGLASYTKRIGVSSIYRLQDGHLDTANYKNCLRRLANISSHEIGHMFSLHHCLYASCVMNGTNGLVETDRNPLRLCSDCQKKLFWNIAYDNKRRLKQLGDFCKKNGLQRDWQILKADLDAIYQSN
ncbi:archaemetzincin [Chitinophaga sp. CF418]|uniref:archaemetzincin n=1 Tax=Chitinophaga sp. CF418 TaxID=1855287 RepID=UPI00091383FF|nr:archaemetzincin [Chitinophaga sp. CF418]SHL98969.1 archaemetzincin [Chitinophaga sp. CF418]